MAQQFLDGLPKANIEGLPGDGSSMISQDVYGTKTEEDSIVESALRLPCGHDMGADCIRTWLSGKKEAKNPCRVTLFPAQPRPYMEHKAFMEKKEEEDDEGDDWHGARGGVDLPRAEPNQALPSRKFCAWLERPGRLPREGRERARTEAGEEDGQRPNSESVAGSL